MAEYVRPHTARRFKGSLSPLNPFINRVESIVKGPGSIIDKGQRVVNLTARTLHHMEEKGLDTLKILSRDGTTPLTEIAHPLLVNAYTLVPIALIALAGGGSLIENALPVTMASITTGGDGNGNRHTAFGINTTIETYEKDGEVRLGIQTIQKGTLFDRVDDRHTHVHTDENGNKTTT